MLGFDCFQSKGFSSVFTMPLLVNLVVSIHNIGNNMCLLLCMQLLFFWDQVEANQRNFESDQIALSRFNNQTALPSFLDINVLSDSGYTFLLNLILSKCFNRFADHNVPDTRWLVGQLYNIIAHREASLYITMKLACMTLLDDNSTRC